MSNVTPNPATHLPIPNPMDCLSATHPIYWEHYIAIIEERNLFASDIVDGLTVQNAAGLSWTIARIHSSINAVNAAATSHRTPNSGDFPLGSKIATDLCRWAHEVIDLMTDKGLVDQRFYDGFGDAVVELFKVTVALGEEGMGQVVCNHFNRAIDQACAEHDTGDGGMWIL